MRKVWQIFFALGSLTFALGANGAEPGRYSVQNLAAACRGTTATGPEGNINYATCYGIIRAFRDGYDAGVATALWAAGVHVDNSSPEALAQSVARYRLFCITLEVDNVQAGAVFLKWVERNPERWHLGYALGLSQAFKEAWPCPKR